MYIVGIDIAKRKHEAAVIDESGTVIMKSFSFTNNCSGYNRLIGALRKASLPLTEVQFAMEATGHYWLPLFARLQREGFRVQVINPVQTNSIRSFYIRQAKTDPRDALLIAEVIRFGHFSESTLHPENIYELRELCRGRHAVVSIQSDVKRKIIALLDQVFPEYEKVFTDTFGDTSLAILLNCPTPRELTDMNTDELCQLIQTPSRKRFGMAKAQELQELARSSFGFNMVSDIFSAMIKLYAQHIVFLKQQIQEMDDKIAEIMSSLDTCITTITGIGPTLGAIILSEIGDISRFPSAAKLAAYAGIDPTMRQSGEYNGVRNRMSKRGSPYLRHAIWLATSSAVLHDPALRAYFQKKRAEGKPYMASLGHACRKMVSIIYAVMRDNKTYIPNILSA
jgi:transposase